MPDVTPGQYGTPTAGQAQRFGDAAKNGEIDPLAAWWAMLTGQGSGVSADFGRGGIGAAGILGTTPEMANQQAANAEAAYLPQQVQNGAANDAMFRAGAGAAPNANPYSSIVANQARPAQEALYAQMQAQQAGPSVAAMQGQRAQGQNLQAALGAGAGRPVMMQAGQIGAGLAAQTGSGRLAEQLRGSAGLGSMVGGVRGADLTVAGQQAQTGLQQRGLDDAMRQFYAGQGSRLYGADADLANERAKLIASRKIAKDQRDQTNLNNFQQSAATTLSAGMG